MSDFLLVGLGNPGPKYEGTRHNFGFSVIERFAKLHKIALTSNKFHGRYASASVDGFDIGLLMPQTFMNLSGKSVAAAVQFFKFEMERLLVIHDEIDLPLGSIRFKEGGGHGGHNGLRDLKQSLGTGDFCRVRMGVGRSEHGDVTHHVLCKFRPDEVNVMEQTRDLACEAISVFLREGLQAAQNSFNGCTA